PVKARARPRGRGWGPAEASRPPRDRERARVRERKARAGPARGAPPRAAAVDARPEAPAPPARGRAGAPRTRGPPRCTRRGRLPATPSSLLLSRARRALHPPADVEGEDGEAGGEHRLVLPPARLRVHPAPLGRLEAQELVGQLPRPLVL